jgi:ABC-2 type transport system permease protein
MPDKSVEIDGIEVTKMHRHPSQYKAFYTMTWYVLKAMVRNRATLLFGLAFPIAFVMIFGLVGSGNTKVRVGIPDGTSQNNPVIQSVKNVSVLSVQNDSKSNLDDKLRQGKIDAELLIDQKSPSSYSVDLITSTGNPATAATTQSVMRGVIDQLNLSLSGISKPPIVLSSQEISGRQSRYIDFALPGQIGFSIMSLSVFGLIFGFVFLKKELVFKRMFATPVRAITILMAQGASRLILAFVQTCIIIGVGVFALNFYLPHGFTTLLELLILTPIGLIAFMGFGLFVSGFAKDENSAAPLAQLISLPQFLLSGVFFPTDNFPAWMQPIANNLPLSYFNEAIRKVTTEGGTLVDTWPMILGLLAWGAVMYILAARTFSWEP